MNNKFEEVNCVICGSEKFYSFRNSNLPDSTLNLGLCKNCGLAYLNPRWKKEVYQEYYNSQYDREYRSGPTQKPLKDEKNIIVERFKRYNITSENSFKVLDIGSGDGSNLNAIKINFPQANLYAIEPSIDSQKKLTESQIDLIGIDVDSDWESRYKDYFDVIVMRHVLEHFSNPLDVLCKVRKVLKNEGIVYIAVPDNLKESRTEGWLRVAHTYYFNKYSLNNILSKANLNILHIVEGDNLCNEEVFIFANKNQLRNEVNISSEHYLEQKRVFKIALDKMGNKNLKGKIKSKLIKALRLFLKPRNSKSNRELPQIQQNVGNGTGKAITHISAFSYGNAGDTLLPIALQDSWNSGYKNLEWTNKHVHEIVTDKLVSEYNKTNGVIIGGGGLFLKDTNLNKISGWQWPCAIEMLNKIEVPLVLYAVGYNRFRGQEEFEPYFKENLQAIAAKAEYIGIRNYGSIDALKSYLPNNLHEKLRYQPCMTTFLAKLYPQLCEYNNKENFIAINAAFDRSHLRFGESIGNILTEVAKVAKVLSKDFPIKFYSHMKSDEAILPFLQSHGVKYEVVTLSNVHPTEIIKAYAKPKLVIGMRGHAQMIPFGCNTPIVSIVSHDKMQWFLNDIKKPNWGADVLSASFGKDLENRAFDSLNNTTDEIEFIQNKQSELLAISMDNVQIGLKAMKLI